LRPFRLVCGRDQRERFEEELLEEFEELFEELFEDELLDEFEELFELVFEDEFELVLDEVLELVFDDELLELFELVFEPDRARWANSTRAGWAAGCAAGTASTVWRAVVSRGASGAGAAWA
jgi:hypothetical protein